MPEHRIFVRLRRQTVAEQAECASTASTTSLHPAVSPPIQALCTLPQGMQRGICSVYSPQWGFSSAWEGQCMNEWTGWACRSQTSRLWTGSPWVRHSWSYIVSEKGDMFFFPPPSECVCAGVALFHRFISSFFFSFFSPTLRFSHIWHRHLPRSLRSQVHGPKSDQLVTCIRLGLSDTSQSLGLPPTDSKQRKLKIRRFKLERSEFLLSC